MHYCALYNDISCAYIIQLYGLLVQRLPIDVQYTYRVNGTAIPLYEPMIYKIDTVVTSVAIYIDILIGAILPPHTLVFLVQIPGNFIFLIVAW